MEVVKYFCFEEIGKGVQRRVCFFNLARRKKGITRQRPLSVCVSATAKVIQSEECKEADMLGYMQAENCLGCARECRQREDGGVYVPVWQS